MPEPQTHEALPPRERLQRYGAAALEDAELLAIMLRTGLPGTPVLTLARHLLQRHGGLHGLLHIDLQALQALDGLGPAKACQLHAVLELVRRACHEPLRTRCVLDQPQAVAHFCMTHFAGLRVEHCIALYLDVQLRLQSWSTVSRGTIDQTTIYPRELLREALARHASAVILAHNHPSGDPTPSQQDIALTQRLQAALALVDVQLLDHLVIGGRRWHSILARLPATP